MRLLFVHPGPLLYTRVFLRLEPLGLELVADAARRAGHATRLIDLQVETHADYRRMILLGWKGFIESGRLKLLPKAQAAPVIDAVERDLRAIAALSSGALKFYYFVALGGRRRAAVS